MSGQISIKVNGLAQSIDSDQKPTHLFADDSKTVVKCSEEEKFVPEVGFAMALVKKQFPNRSEFLRMIDKAYVQPVRNKAKK